MLKSVPMAPDNLESQIQSLQKQISDQLVDFSQSLQNDVPFHVLKEIHVRIIELKDAVKRLQES